MAQRVIGTGNKTSLWISGDNVTTIVRKEFWKLPLEELTAEEWELLCDGCGRCCLKKVQDDKSNELFWTRVACRYLDQNCRCSNYAKRTDLVPTCLNVKEMYEQNTNCMPDTCAYRLRSEKKPLRDWHPLLTNNEDSIINAGISVSGKTLSEEYVHEGGYDEHVIRWVKS